MTLKDLEAFDPVTIQCHDNPDADALGAALVCMPISRAWADRQGLFTAAEIPSRSPI